MCGLSSFECAHMSGGLVDSEGSEAVADVWCCLA